MIPKRHQFSRAQRRRAARMTRRANRPTPRAQLRAQVLRYLDESLIIEPITGQPTSRFLPNFESEWTPTGFAVPEYWTNNSWRALQTSWRAMWGLPAMPYYPETADIDIFCDPSSDQTIVETGNGTLATPYRLLASARTAAIALAAPGTVIGIAAGIIINDQSLTLTATGNFMQINGTALAGTLWVIWFKTPGVRTPSVLRRMKQFGSLTSHWLEVDMKSASPAGTVIATNGVFTPSPGSGNWHLEQFPTTVLTTNSMGVGFGVRDSILSIVDLDDYATYKAHGINSTHACRNAMSEGTAGQAVKPTTNYQPLAQDMQITATPSGGVVIKSPTNPATRWPGGVWLIDNFHSGISITANNIFWGNALQFEYCGTGVRMTVNAGQTLTGVVIEGIFTRCCVNPYYFASTSNPTPVGAVHQGAIHMGCPGNESFTDPTQGQLGDGTMPWMSNCRVEYIRSVASFSGVSHNGWIKGLKVFNSRHHAMRLICGSSVYFGQIHAFAYTDYVEFMHFHLTCIDNGCGTFGDSDGGIDIDANSCNVRIHHGRIMTSLRAGQINGGGRGCMMYMIDAQDCVLGWELADSMEQGTAEGSIDHCRVTGSARSAWATCTSGLAASNKMLKSIGLLFDERSNMEPRGPILDAETRFHNNHFRVRNVEVDIGTALAAEWYGIQNDTIEAEIATSPEIIGAWEDTTPSGPTHKCRNGLDVTPGQTQRSRIYACPMNGIRIVGGNAAQHVTDRDYATCAIQTAAIVNLQTVATNERNFDGTLKTTAPGAAQVGNVYLGPIMEGPNEPWLQPAASRFDLRGRFATDASQVSIGPYHYNGQVAENTSAADFALRMAAITDSTGFYTNFTNPADVTDFIWDGNWTSVDAPWSLSGSKAMKCTLLKTEGTGIKNWWHFLRNNLKPYGSAQNGMDDEYWLLEEYYITADEWNWFFQCDGSKKFSIVSNHPGTVKHPVTRATLTLPLDRTGSSVPNEVVHDDKDQRMYLQTYRDNGISKDTLIETPSNNPCSSTDFLYENQINEGVKTGTPLGYVGDPRGMACRDHTAQFGPRYSYGGPIGKGVYRDDPVNKPFPDTIAAGSHLQPGYNAFLRHFRFPNPWTGTANALMEDYVWHRGDTAWKLVNRRANDFNMSGPSLITNGVPWNGGVDGNYHKGIWVTPYRTGGLAEPARLDMERYTCAIASYQSAMIAPPSGVAYDGTF